MSDDVPSTSGVGGAGIEQYLQQVADHLRPFKAWEKVGDGIYLLRADGDVSVGQKLSRELLSRGYVVESTHGSSLRVREVDLVGGNLEFHREQPVEDDEPEVVTDGGSTLDPSIWDRHPENTPTNPKVCPHCEEDLAHQDDLKDNDEIDAYALFFAYRKHRQAHFDWGDDPERDGAEPGDPYLASYYDTNRSAAQDPIDEDEASGDPDEVVGEVFDVTVSYEAQLRARVVAPDKHRAKEKAKDMRLMNEEDLSGYVPDTELTHEVHSEARSVKEVTRSQDELAERMEGWPW